MLGRVDAIDADIAVLDAEIEAHLAPFEAAYLTAPTQSPEVVCGEVT
jgi:hypothetical protein